MNKEGIETIEENETLPQNIINLRNLWYNRTFIGLEIVNYAKTRETCFLGSKYNKKDNIRYINISFIDMLYKYLGITTNKEKQENVKSPDPYHFLSNKKNYNIYSSLATINWSISPVKSFSFSPKKRRIQQELFKDSMDNLLIDMDGGLDMDGDQDFKWNYNKKHKSKIKEKIQLDITPEEALKRALKDSLQVLKLFDEYKIVYWIQFSGSRGFHIRYKIPLNITFEKKLELVNVIMQRIGKTLNLKTLDPVRLNSRKVLKMPYSLVCKREKAYVVLPLDNYQINNLKLSDLEVNNVLSKIKIKGRGVIWRNENINKDVQIEYFNKFLSDFEIKL